MFVLDSSSSTSLVQQIVNGFRQSIEDGSLRAGSKLPSIRQFAQTHDVSVYTAVDAYEARPGDKETTPSPPPWAGNR